MIESINERYDEFTSDLEVLGKEPSDDPAGEMMGLITDLHSRLDASVMGHSGSEAFMQDIKAALEVYKGRVWATAPRFHPFTAEEVAAKKRGTATPLGSAMDMEGIVDIAELKEGGSSAGGPYGIREKKPKVMLLSDIREHIER